jgi:hypothetical protein
MKSKTCHHSLRQVFISDIKGRSLRSGNDRATNGKNSLADNIALQSRWIFPTFPSARHKRNMKQPLAQKGVILLHLPTLQNNRSTKMFFFDHVRTSFFSILPLALN